MKLNSTKRAIFRALLGAVMLIGAVENSSAAYCMGSCTLLCIGNCGMGSDCTYCNATYYTCSNCF